MDKRIAYKLVAHAVAKDISRPKLAAPYLDEKKQAMVGADGFRCVMIELDPPEKYYDYIALIPTTYQVILEVSIPDLINTAKLHNANKGALTKVFLVDDVNSEESPSLIFKQENMSVQSAISCRIVEDKRVSETDIFFAINSQYLYDLAMAVKTYQNSYTITIAHTQRWKKHTKICPFTTINIQIASPTSPVLFSVGEYREVIMPMFTQW